MGLFDPFAPLKKPLLPDARGFYGEFGGRYVPELLQPNLAELEVAFYECLKSKSFWQAFVKELQEFSGRPTPITFLNRLSAQLGGAKIFLKREDLNQTGAHKVNNVIGQGLLAKRLGKTRIIAETGAGQHGVATATMCARFGFKARIYMGSEDVYRQRPNVFWMQKLGAEVIPVESGSKTLKDAINEALRDWSANLHDTHYLLGTCCGPHPFPALVAYLQSIIGIEALSQMQSQFRVLPDKIFACVGGGSNALGIFQAFLPYRDVELVGVEAGGKGKKLGSHASRIASKQGTVGIAQGYKTIFLQNRDGQMIDTHSVSAGLDYIGVSPLLAYLHQERRVRFSQASDKETLAAAKLLMSTEGIIPALESSHALAQAFAEAAKMSPTENVLVNLSGRGDKDIFTFAETFADENWYAFLKTKVSGKKARAKK